MQDFFERLFESCRLLERAFVLVDVECRESCRGRYRVPGIGIAVEEFDHELGTLHEGIVEVLP